jgi:hypothetical protein
VHFIQQPRVNISTLRSNGVYHSTTGTPLSSIRQVPSTTTTTSAVKSKTCFERKFIVQLFHIIKIVNYIRLVE